MTAWTPEELYLVTERAYGLYLEGRLRESAILFEGVSALDPRKTYGRKALATVYLNQKEPDRALAHAEAALQADPADLEARLRRCEALVESGRASSALPDFEILKNALPRVESRRLELRMSRAMQDPAVR